MPTIARPTVNVPPPLTEAGFTTCPPAEDLPPMEVEAPIFHMQQDTVQVELTALRDNQPAPILHRNFQDPISIALSSERTALYNAIKDVRRVIVLKQLYDVCPQKYKRQFANIIADSVSSRTVRIATDPDAEVRDTLIYRHYENTLSTYIAEKELYLTDKPIFGPQQARYNQQIAMIRQKPRTRVTINTQEIVETLCQWPNIWGVSAYVNTIDNALFIRIGACDIIMSESAPETAYDNPVDILLAPFVFQIRLDADSRFICSSEHALGLSWQSNRGGTYSDFHPHQLSDTPCFGTFAQSLNEMASVGDVVSLVSGVLAFYGQYNSQDSAGVNAKSFHPSHLEHYAERNSYRNRLVRKIDSYNFNTIDFVKLDAALDAYSHYHEETRHERAPLVVECEEYCADCAENPVSDDHEYFIEEVDGNRICRPCWENYYCNECDRHVENCTCEFD